MAAVESCPSAQVPDQVQPNALDEDQLDSSTPTSPGSGDSEGNTTRDGVSKRELRAARNNNIVPPAILRRRLNPAFALPFTVADGLGEEEVKGTQAPSSGEGRTPSPLHESSPSLDSQDTDSQAAGTPATKSLQSRGKGKTETGALRIDCPEWDEEVQRTLPPASYGMQAKHANFSPMVFRVCFKCNMWTRRGKNLILERGKYCCMRQECQQTITEYDILYRPLSGFFNQKSQCGSCGIACTPRSNRTLRIANGYKCCEWKSCEMYLQTLEKGTELILSTSVLDGAQRAEDSAGPIETPKPKRKAAKRKAKPDAPTSPISANLPQARECEHTPSPETEPLAYANSPDAIDTKPESNTNGHQSLVEALESINGEPLVVEEESPCSSAKPKAKGKRQPRSQIEDVNLAVKRRRRNPPAASIPSVAPALPVENETKKDSSPKRRRGANIPGDPHSWFNVNVGSRYAVPPVGGKWKGKMQVPDDEEEDRISPVLQRELDRNIPQGLDLTAGDNVEVTHGGKVYLLCSVCEGWTLKDRTTKEHEKFSACKRPKCIVKSEATLNGFLVGGRPACGFFTYRTPDGLRCQSCGRENKEFRSINGYRVCDLTPCKVYAISLPEYQDEQWKKIRPVGVFNTMDCSKRGVKKKVGFTSAARAAKRATPTAKPHPAQLPQNTSTPSMPSSNSVPDARQADIFTGEARQKELQRLRNFASEARMTADRLARAMPIMQRKVAAGMPPLPQKSALIFSNEEFAEFVTYLESLAIKSRAKPICAKRLHLTVPPDCRPSELTHVIEGELSDSGGGKRSFHLSFVEEHKMWGICDGGKKYVLSRIEPVTSDVVPISIDATYNWDKILAAMTKVTNSWTDHCVLAFRSFPVPKAQSCAQVGFILEDDTVAPTDAPELGIVKTIEREIESFRAYKELLWSGRQEPECDICHKVRPGGLCGNASVLACMQWLCKACKKAQSSAPEPEQLPNWIDESKVDQFLPHRVLVTAPPPSSFLPQPPAGFPPIPSAAFIAGAPQQYTPLQMAPPPQQTPLQLAHPPYAPAQFGNYANRPPWQPSGEYAKGAGAPPWQMSRPWGPYQNEARSNEYPEDEGREAGPASHLETGFVGRECEGKGNARQAEQGAWEHRKKGSREGKGWRGDYSDQWCNDKGQSGEKGQRPTKGRGRGERPYDKPASKGQRSQSYSLSSDCRHDDSRWQRDRGREHAYRDKRSPEAVYRSPSPDSTCAHCQCVLADWMRTNGRFAENVCEKAECLSRFPWRGEVIDATPPAVTHFFVSNEHVARLLGKDALLPRDAAVREQNITVREKVSFQLRFLDGKPVATNVCRI